MSNETTLLPCPFCGGKAEFHIYNTTCLVECSRCHIGTTHHLIEEYENAIAAWNTRAELGSEINGDTSDGYHTFNELYHHRAVLFSVIVRDHRELAWKAMKHHDGTMYDGMFIVGIETPKGQATYHYDLDPYWEMFDCEEREFAPEWDGHTPDEAIARIAELGSKPPYDELLRYLANDWHISASWDGLRKFWCIELTEEGVKLRDATHGTLTAEQVREAIFSGSVYASYDGAQYYANGINMQAIAAELNAEIGGKCMLVETDSYSNAYEVIHVLECSECGETCEHVNGSYKRCPNCGRQVSE